MVGWTFLTNHAQVLLCIAHNNRATARQIATKVGITDRAVQRIIDNLEAEGYISRTRSGRNNLYTIHGDHQLRHVAQENRTVRDLLYALGAEV